MIFTAITIEGGLLPLDLLEAIQQGEAPGQKEADFGIPQNQRLTEEIASAWSDAKAYWQAFQRALNRLQENDPATSSTRDQWMVPLLRSLGYKEILYTREAEVIEGSTFAISHRVGSDVDSTPIHIEGFRTELGKRPPTGRPRLSPHALLQEYLNRTEHLWGLVTNGDKLRILRENSRATRPTYVEFDLRQIMEGEKYSEFSLFYRLTHSSRFPKEKENASLCWLEQYHQKAIETGGRVRDKLRDGVEKALKIFGNGFLQHPANTTLRDKIKKKELDSLVYYRQLLRLIYRLLFLMVSEERNLLGTSAIYRDYYSISRLRKLAEASLTAEDRHDDLWIGLKTTFCLFSDETLSQKLEISPLNGELFGSSAMPELKNTQLDNASLLSVIRCLSLYDEEKIRRRVNYAALDVEELGSVYESLLDFHPTVDDQAAEFDLVAGTERKSTGSYYTRPELVQELIKSALVPVIEEKLKEAKTSEEKEKILLSLKVCDPACGSGHFLLAASRRIGKELARIRSKEDEPSPESFRLAVRDVIAHCIYGVDLNPLAVDLCKLALWLEGHSAGKPLSFLDHRIKCGNSLIGVFSREDILKGIPDEAFNPVTGDKKLVAQALKKQNREERKAWGKGEIQIPFDFENSLKQDAAQFAKIYHDFESIKEDTPEAVHEKARAYETFRNQGDWLRDNNLAHLWTSAYFFAFTEKLKPFIPTHGKLMEALQKIGLDDHIYGHAWELAQQHNFFHWFLEFPDVFEAGGFDCVLGNPPWERIELKEEEFFSSRDPKIAEAPNKAARERMIRELQGKNPVLWQEFQEAKHFAETQSKFLRNSERFPLTARGSINTYAVFAELFRDLLNPYGRSGVIVPTGIATDDTCKEFFGNLVKKNNLAQLIGFENEAFIFPSVHHSFKFCALTITGPNSGISTSNLAFFCRHFDHVQQTPRYFQLSAEDFSLLNPNTRTCPVFRTRVDAELTKQIYRNVPVLVNERTGENPWGIHFMSMFQMSNDSHLFRTRDQLEREGFRLFGNRFMKGSELWLPLYEGKMIWQFDHRHGSYEARGSERGFSTLPIPSPETYANFNCIPQTFYWVQESKIDDTQGAHRSNWFLGFRNVTNTTNERTAIFSLIPRTAVGHSMPLIFSQVNSSPRVACLLANLNTIALDYQARQKVGGTNLTYNYLQQFPSLPPAAYTTSDLESIVPRVLELVYTAWDIKAFADDVWCDADESLHALIRKQHDENRAATGGNEWKLPDWIEAYPEIEWNRDKGIPLSPFKWDESRRAALRAELDAYYAKLYGLTRKQLRYILDPADLTERELQDILDPWEEVSDPLDPAGYAERAAKSTFPGETFRVLKEKERRQFGTYRTRTLVLEAWSRLSQPVSGAAR